jgi:hypothetical protein
MKRKPFKKAMLVFIVISSFVLVVGIGGIFSPGTIAQGNKEIGLNKVQGIVLSIKIGAFARGVIDVKSAKTGKTYTFYVGKNTTYNPPRYPAFGETVRVNYINDRGKLKATLVEIIESLK